MYPTLIIVVCAVDKSLNEAPSKGHAQTSTIMFNIPKNGPRQTLSELVSQTSTPDDVCPSVPEDPTESKHLVLSTRMKLPLAIPMPRNSKSFVYPERTAF